MRHRSVLMFLLAATAFLAAAGPSKVPEPKIRFDPRTYVCAKAPVPVVVDGEIDEPVWDKAPWSDAFVDIEGSLKPKPRLRTMVKMLWDDNYFYIAGYLEEPDLWATLTRRDSIIFQDNDFEVFIDPDGDTHNYYELEMNALNTVWDLFLVRPYRDGGPAIHAWDIQGLKTAVKLAGTLNQPGDKDKSWFVEIAMPWDILKEAAGRQGGAEAGRPLAGQLLPRRVPSGRQERRLRQADRRPGQASARGQLGLVAHRPGQHPLPRDVGDRSVLRPTPAGRGRESVQERPEDEARWALRRIYYRQWALQAEKRRFRPRLEVAGVEGQGFQGQGLCLPAGRYRRGRAVRGRLHGDRRQCLADRPGRPHRRGTMSYALRF